MNKRALLGIYTICALALLLGLFAVLSDFGTRLRGYKIGVRFPSAGGIHSGALVYENGVVVGSVDKVSLLPDYTTEIILALRNEVSVPRNARFLILQPLQGDPTLRINSDHRPNAKDPQPLERRVLPLAEQPLGQTTMSIAEFLARGQDQFEHVDDLMQQFAVRGPRILAGLEQTLNNTNALTLNANRSLVLLSSDMHRSISNFNSSSSVLTAQLSESLNRASADLIGVTHRLNMTAQAGQPHLDHLFVQLDSASSSLASSVDSLHAIASDPHLHDNVVRSAKSFADTAATMNALLGDFRQITGNEQTQAQLRDAVANMDAASQRANAFLGRFGKSDVEGVDRPQSPVTPVPQAAASGAPGVVMTPAPLQMKPGPLQNPGVYNSAPPGTPVAPHARRESRKSARLVSVGVRLGELSPLHQDRNGTDLASPLLNRDRGPQTDLSLTAFPDSPTSFLVGVNDIGNNGTLSLMPISRRGNAYLGGGILYSRLGVLSGYDAGPVGVQARVYDPRRGSVDLYGNVHVNPTTTIFAGQRDATRNTRRNVYGLDFHF